MEQVGLWMVFEFALQGSKDYQNPFWDQTVRIEFTSASGKKRTVEAFWDGGRTWRVRFSPDETGKWFWRSRALDANDGRLDLQEGSFQSVPYRGKNTLYQRGPVGLSKDRRHFVHADGTPFFWLADTAWNGVLRADPNDWQEYLRTRALQQFTAIQFVSTQWRGLSKDPSGEKAYEGDEHIRLNPAFFQRLDGKVAAINEHGLVAAPVILWAVNDKEPGFKLAEADAQRLTSYIVARWGAHQVIWILGGDGNYRGQRAERWKRIGRAVFGERHDRLVTMHPNGQSSYTQEFRGEPWFDFIGYQSGHGSSDDHLRWLIEGPPAKEWKDTPALPVVNLEPNYEKHPSYHAKKQFTDREVRRAAYWSLLVAPPAGVTYGCNPIWVWPPKPEPAEGHNLGIIDPWRTGLDLPGAKCMSILRKLFEALPWWDLRPAQGILAEQPGTAAPRLFIAAAATEDGTIAVAYTPEGGRIALNALALKLPLPARWFNPRSGEWTDAGGMAEAKASFNAPDGNDWVLVLGGVK